MPFIGKNPTAGFATIVKDDFTADGSTTVFTLSKQVATVNDIAVYVGNVRQEPTDAYTVNGTTLTMSAAPATGVNFYVLHIAGTIESSVVPPDGSIGTAKLVNNAVTSAKIAAGAVDTTELASGAVTSAKLDTNIDIAGNLDVDGTLNVSDDLKFIGGATPQFGIGTLTPNRKFVVYGNNASGAEISLTNTDMTADKRTLNFYMSGDKANMRMLNDAGTAGTNAIEFTSEGYVTKPNQISFFAGWTTTSNAGGYGSVQYGNAFGTVGWNIGSGWDSAGTFTAPVAGKYLIYLAMSFTSGANRIHAGFYINGGGGTTSQGNSGGDPWLQTGLGNEGSSDQDHVFVSKVFNLNANDTLKPVYLIFDNDNNSQIYANRSFVGGYLLG